MKHTAFAAVAVLGLLTTSVPAHAKSKKARLEEERIAKEVADRKAKEEAEAAAKAAEQEQAERAAEAKRRESRVTVRVDTSFADVHLVAADGSPEVTCGSPCIATLKVGTSYRITAKGMQPSTPLIATKDTTLWKVAGKSTTRKWAGIGVLAAGGVIGGVCAGLVEVAQNEEASLKTQQDFAIAGLATCGVSLAVLVTGAILYIPSTSASAEYAPRPATASSKPRFHWNGSVTF